MVNSNNRFINRVGHLCRRAFNKLIYHKVTVLFFKRDKSSLKNGAANDISIDIERVSLEKYQAQAVQYEWLLNKVEEAKTRFDDGHDVYFFFDKSPALIHVAWVRTLPFVEAEFELKKGARINLAASEPTIYDVWTPDEQRGKGHYKKALSKLTDELLLQHANVWIYCLETNTASSRGILQTGFELQRSMTVKYYLGRQSKLELH